MIVKRISNSLEETLEIAARVGSAMRGGEVVELISDVGGGKTTFVRGLAQGMGSPDQVQSPTFTISRVYRAKELELYHFDFYRLHDPGVMREALAEAIDNTNIAVVIEWSQVVQDVLPQQRLQVEIVAVNENQRELIFTATGQLHARLLKELS